mgnify:CR=1 FL=1
MIWEEDREIDLFSLYVLLSHFRPCDATRGNSFFQMLPYARANVRITNEKQKENSHEGITWCEMDLRLKSIETSCSHTGYFWKCVAIS